MRTTFLNLILLFVIVGCKQPTINKVQQAVEAQAKLLVDSGLIANEYVVLYELAINDSNHIYSIQAADCPADLKFEYPSKIIKYKDKYLCFIELDEAPMSAKEMIEASSYSGNLVVEGDGGKSWLLVVSKLGEKKILIDTSLLRGWGTYFNITELWPYFSGYVKGCPVQMGVMSHDVELSDSYLSCNVDSIKRNLLWNENQNTTMIKNVYGQMYLKNNTDSVVYLSSSTKKHYAVVDGQDTPFLQDELVAVVHTHSKLAVSDEIAPEDLPNIPLVLRERGSGTLDVFERSLLRHNLKLSSLNVLMYLGSTESIKLFLEHTDCMGIVSIRSVYKELVAGNFRVVEIKGMPMQREFNFVQLQGQEGGLSQAFMRFAGHHSKSL